MWQEKQEYVATQSVREKRQEAYSLPSLSPVLHLYTQCILTMISNAQVHCVLGKYVLMGTFVFMVNLICRDDYQVEPLSHKCDYFECGGRVYPFNQNVESFKGFIKNVSSHCVQGN